MSGGSWDYFCYSLDEIAGRLKDEKATIRRAFGDHLELCSKALHDIEWVDSGDYGDGDDVEAIKKVLADTLPEKSIEQAKSELVQLRDQINNILAVRPTGKHNGLNKGFKTSIKENQR